MRRLSLVTSLLLFLSMCAPGSMPTPATTPTATNIPIPTPTQAQRGETIILRILFVGNSHIFMNDLPNTFAELARSGGYEVNVDSSAEGGYTLEEHSVDSDTLEKIDSAKWDFVVLQENTNIPRVESERRECMYPAVRALDERIRNGEAQTVLFMTWASPDTLTERGLDGFVEEQERVSTGFLTIAKELDTLVAPVGVAWTVSLMQRPELDLWQHDNVHASRIGTYLVACVFYAVIYQQSPEGLSYRAGISEDTTQFLQSIAAETVLGAAGPAWGH